MGGSFAVERYGVVKLERVCWDGGLDTEFRGSCGRMTMRTRHMETAGKKGAEGGRRATWTAAGPPRPKYRSLQLMLARL